ncbi:hypothetical protein [Mycolicibacterium diernhoferi]|uniref:Uncharacterized protein n=1 Tax=Mycolicibacterium diernhoferi TaxID=1801 RepID=A0A1Q4HBX1_9MYCO|nr:hypothetical protein [Mycolicibacterium diernhoferi]OJZ65047.1 hypothetical protein BRW64_14455 [Mycolicibacterium diernhoferi]OPE55383.1 hypothetical protein BV510_05405 [Mycolicibacterium diernhoferi]PEG52243.1 hypothetical protein CRI78_22220 [Mycolicibacterium diernhoferi]QYL23745.1 hypothetical protein K0O62_05440 [Mycolicibacterium diernhoferi]
MNIGIAAGAVAAAATLLPVSVAHADTEAAPTGSLGSQVGSAQCVPTATTSCAPIGLPSAAALAAAASNPGFPDNLIQNKLWWLGRANDKPRSTILEFTPMSLVPGFLKPLYGWFTAKWDLEVCVFGLTATLGPYGTTKLSVGRGCN